MVSPTTRSGKGSELSWAELDANFTAIAAAVNFLLPTDTSFATAIPFTGNLYMPQQTVSSVLAFTAAGGAQKGAHVYVRLVADGTHAPTFTGIKEWGGSSGYDNRAGITNELEFFFDGADFWYCFSQEVGASATDTTAPTASSSQVANAAPTVVVITMSESLDSGYTPATSAFTVSGHTVSNVAISGSTISVTVSSAFVNGEAARTVSYTQPGTNQARDTAGNLLASFSSLAITNNVVAVANAVTMTGPTSGASGSPSTNFSIGVSPGGGAITGTVVVTPSDSSGGGTFTPTTVSLTTGSPTATFTYTAGSTGAKTISVTNNGSLSNPSNITYTASSGATAPAQVTGLTLGTATDTTQPLTWTAPSNGGSAITDYVIQYAIASSGSWTTFSDGTSTTASTTVTGLTASTSYDYRVAAVNAIGTGTNSATSTGSTAAAAATLRFDRAISNVTESGSAPWKYTGATDTTTGSSQGAVSQASLAVGVDGSVTFKLDTYGGGFMLEVGTTAVVDNYINNHSMWVNGGVYVPIEAGGSVMTAANSVTPAAGDLVKWSCWDRATAADFAVPCKWEVSKNGGASWTLLFTSVCRTTVHYAKVVPTPTTVLMATDSTGFA